MKRVEKFYFRIKLHLENLKRIFLTTVEVCKSNFYLTKPLKEIQMKISPEKGLSTVSNWKKCTHKCQSKTFSFDTELLWCRSLKVEVTYVRYWDIITWYVAIFWNFSLQPNKVLCRHIRKSTVKSWCMKSFTTGTKCAHDLCAHDLVHVVIKITL